MSLRKHPLTADMLIALRKIGDGKTDAKLIHPQHRSALLRRGFIMYVDPHPFTKKRDHILITALGKEARAEYDERSRGQAA